MMSAHCPIKACALLNLCAHLSVEWSEGRRATTGNYKNMCLTINENVTEMTDPHSDANRLMRVNADEHLTPGSRPT